MRSDQKLLREREVLLLVWASIFATAGCSGNSDVPAPFGTGGSVSQGGAQVGGTATQSKGGASNSGGASSVQVGGTPSVGGATGSGGNTSIGGANATGGTSLAVGGALSSGGTQARGGSPTGAGGTATVGGRANGGSAAGGKATGGTNVGSGGLGTAGGATARGGNTTGGTATTGGASATGGTSTIGGTSATGGSGVGGGTTCPFPTSFKWKDSGPLATPATGWVSLKDFTNVVYNGQHIVYMSMHDNSAYGSAMMAPFADWPAAATATQTKLPTSTVAPTLFYFTPKSTWILAYQWCSAKFCYATSTNPTSATSWSYGKTLLSENVTGASPTGPIDQTVICDSTNCYLFYADDNGHIYRASMPIGNFPGTFSGSTTILTDSKNNLFEAVQVYSVKGTGEYLMIVEAMGSGGRFFRGFRATSLGGTFTAISGASTESSPFAGKSNVTFTGTAWTNDISHGDMVRSADETQTIDPCNMQLLYQGKNPSSSAAYDLLPYRPGLLTKTN